MLVTPSLGNDIYLSKQKTGLILFYFLLCTIFSGSDTWIIASGFGFLLVWILLGAKIYSSNYFVLLVSL
jgi:hypothetical protein